MVVLKNFNTAAEEGEISKLFAAFLVTIKVDVKNGCFQVIRRIVDLPEFTKFHPKNLL